MGCSLEKSEGESAVQQPVELVIRASQGGATRAMENVDDVIEVGAELAPSTRTELGNGPGVNTNGDVNAGAEQQIRWVNDDQIMVWAEPAVNPQGWAFAQTVFSLAYYNHDYHSADFSAMVASTLDRDYDYTYYAIYPSPKYRNSQGQESAVSGITLNDTAVTYTLSANQSGEYNPAYDIMWGEVSGAALVERDGSGSIEVWRQPELHMKHLLHMMRIRVPEGRNLLGRDVKRLEITFPQAVVGGTATVDVKTGVVTWSGQSNKVTIDLADESLLDEGGRYVWVQIKPEVLNGEISFQAYDSAGVPAAEIKSASINRTLLAGHITPVNMTVPGPLYDVTYVKIIQTANHLGEDWQTMTLSGFEFPQPFTTSKTNSVVVTPNSNNVYEIAVASSAANMQGKQLGLKYESEHTLFDDPITLPASISGTQVNVNKVVPYLLEEDFSQAKSYEKNDDYDYSGDEVTTGYLLNGYMPDNGWNASRFSISGGNSMRINVRYESGGFFVGRYCGRLDTPALSKLKENADATIKVQYDMGCYVRLGRDGLNGRDKLDDTKNAVTSCVAGTHTNSQNSKIDGQNQNDVASQMTLAYTSPFYVSQYGENSFGSTFPTSSFTASGAGKTTRVVWWANTTRADSKLAANCNYYLYIDNIKVSIAN